MLQELVQLLNELKISTEKHGSYQAVSTGFYKQEGNCEELTRTDMPQNEKEYKNVIRKDTPILELAVDQDDPEICLITKYLNPNDDEQTNHLSYAELQEEIQKLIQEYAKYEVLSSSWVQLDTEHVGRVDLPIIAVLIDEEGKKICFVETGDS